MLGKQKIATDPRRVALVEAIAHHEDRSRALEAATAAVDRAHKLADAAETRHHLAKAGLAAWRTNQVSRLHAAAATGEELVQESGRAVWAATEDAADEIESAKSVSADCTASHDRRDWRTEMGGNSPWVCGRAVLTGEVDRLTAKTANLRDKYHEKCATLIWLRDMLQATSA
jgi:hypothetical protein